MGSKSSYLHIMTRAAEKAAFNITRDYGEIEKLQSSRSDLSKFAENAYKRSKDQIKYILSKFYPDILFFGDDHFTGEEKLFWIINPISGRQNFIRSIPYFSISVALCEQKGVVASAVLNPMMGECFKAESGAGAFVNNRSRLRVSLREKIAGALIALNTSHSLESALSANKAVIRKIGDIALDLSYVGAGKLDACITENSSECDVLPGSLIVKESGGFVELRKNESGLYRVIAASSLELMRKLLSFYNTI